MSDGGRGVGNGATMLHVMTFGSAVTPAATIID